MDRRHIEKPLIYLTGFMGAGKTTIGAKLGSNCHLPVVDTDQFIVQTYKQTISEMFQLHGEPYFRKAEESILTNLSKRTAPTIVTTGGGIIMSKQNRQKMKQSGIIIYLHCDFNVIMQRLQQDHSRPLLQQHNRKSFSELFLTRLKHYLECDYVIDTTYKSVSTIVKEICFILNRTALIGNPNIIESES
ncbi:shikimate kinase [Terrilactibacillus laevilacticus]|uniref:Shikimate kinase n=1 Tax=Terrilactibacillus laevilacticus TaxID=1380157 RepID=A0ABW5PTQ4_9BACI|nr:shikimate kinase [Terrilactibacillus laevilacticus]